MGTGASAAPARAQKFKITTTVGHLKDVRRVVASGVVSKLSEALRRAWYEAKAANTAMFREAGGK